MHRRSLLAALGTGLAAGTAGCSGFGADAPTRTPTTAPPPEPSTLRVSVENAASRSHDVTFRLAVTRDDLTILDGFEFRDVEPGETRTREPEELAAGSYELEVTILEPLDMSTTIEWTGRECPVKDVAVQLRDDGLRLRDSCPDE